MKELAFSLTLKDFEVHTFSTSGAGGQRRDKKQTGVRLVHRPSGATGSSSDERSQLQNKRTALKRLANDPKFRYWCDLQIKNKEDWVKENVQKDKFLVENKENGQWVVAEPLTDQEFRRMLKAVNAAN
jgi:protein subunit release factor B